MPNTTDRVELILQQGLENIAQQIASIKRMTPRRASIILSKINDANALTLDSELLNYIELAHTSIQAIQIAENTYQTAIAAFIKDQDAAKLAIARAKFQTALGAYYKAKIGY